MTTRRPRRSASRRGPPTLLSTGTPDSPAPGRGCLPGEPGTVPADQWPIASSPVWSRRETHRRSTPRWPVFSPRGGPGWAASGDLEWETRQAQRPVGRRPGHRTTTAGHRPRLTGCERSATQPGHHPRAGVRRLAHSPVRDAAQLTRLPSHVVRTPTRHPGHRRRHPVASSWASTTSPGGARLPARPAPRARRARPYDALGGHRLEVVPTACSAPAYGAWWVVEAPPRVVVARRNHRLTGIRRFVGCKACQAPGVLAA